MAQAGWSKLDITPKTKDIVMMGYANPKNIVKGSKTPIFVRTLWLKANTDFILIYLDINYITRNLHDDICRVIKEKYAINADQVQITASHTHSAPGGYGERLFYEVPTPGFHDEVYQTYFGKTIESIQEACSNLKDANFSFGQSDFDKDSQVGINRSLASYQRNPEADRSLNQFEAINKTMHGLHIEKENAKAFVSWFGVHTTSIPNYGTEIHFDNKGYACKYMEDHLGKNSLAIFAQGTCGDVSPNFIFDKDVKQTRGPHKDPDQNAAFNGKLQYEKALDILNNLKSFEPEIKATKNIHHFGEASFGVAFIQGTDEGPGVPKPIIHILNQVIDLANLLTLGFLKLVSKKSYESKKKLIRNQSPKRIFIVPNRKEIIHLPIKKGVPLVSVVDPVVRNLNKLVRSNRYKDINWYEEELPLQLIDLGPFIIVSVPFEVTTISGRRIQKSLKEKYNKEIILSTYSNSYAGYITTPEEYDQQAYEGGHTVFGRNSLNTLIDQLNSLT